MSLLAIPGPPLVLVTFYMPHETSLAGTPNNSLVPRHSPRGQSRVSPSMQPPGDRWQHHTVFLAGGCVFSLPPSFATQNPPVAITDCSPLWLKTSHRLVFLTRRARRQREAFCGDAPDAAPYNGGEDCVFPRILRAINDRPYGVAKIRQDAKRKHPPHPSAFG